MKYKINLPNTFFPNHFHVDSSASVNVNDDLDMVPESIEVQNSERPYWDRSLSISSDGNMEENYEKKCELTTINYILTEE